MSGKRQWYAVTAWKVYQNASLGIFDRLECLRNMFGTCVGDAGYKPMRIQSFFWKFRVAIDLHEESSFMAQVIFTNPLTWPFVFTLVCIATRFIVISCIQITYSAGLGRHLYQGVLVWLTLPCRKITTRNRRIRRPWATRSIPILGPSARNLVCMYTKVMKRFYVRICTYVASIVYRQTFKNV